MDPSAQPRSISPSPNPLYCLDTSLQDQDVEDIECDRTEQAQVSKNNNEPVEKDDVDSTAIETEIAPSPMYEFNYPRVNCPEKIVICLDMSSEMSKLSFRSRSGDKFASLKMIKRALGLFLQTKSRLNVNHQFALIIIQEEACWVTDFTYSSREIMHYLDEYNTTSDCDSFDLTSLFNTLKDNVELPVVVGDQSVIPPPYIVRAVLIYGRSQCQISLTDKESQKFLESSPYFFLDAFYIHEPVSDENKCEATFNKLCELDFKGLSYVFEISRNPTRLHDFMAQLMAHPLQRPLQGETAYKIQAPEENR